VQHFVMVWIPWDLKLSFSAAFYHSKIIEDIKTSQAAINIGQIVASAEQPADMTASKRVVLSASRTEDLLKRSGSFNKFIDSRLRLNLVRSIFWLTFVVSVLVGILMERSDVSPFCQKALRIQYLSSK
jgi:hypothetical protein